VKEKERMKSLSMLLLLVVVVSVSCQSLPSGFEGVWVGVPDFSELGPWGVNMNFTITAINSSPTQWVMRDIIPPAMGIRNSFQDFYVYGDTQTMHYCGCIRNFYSTSMGTPTTVAYYNITTNTDSKLVFCLQGTDQPCDTTWTLTLKDENTLTSTYKFPSPVKHLDATFTRDTSSSLDGLSLTKEEKVKIQDDAAQCWDNNKYWDANCIFTNDTSATFTPTSRCPYAEFKHTYSGGGELKDEKQKKEPTKLPLHPKTGEAYQFCYKFNEVAGYTFSWNFNSDEQTIDGMIQMPVSDDQTFAAFGIANFYSFPDAPGMNNSDIVMGWADNNCVVSLYSDKVTGAPGLSDDQVITNTATSYEDGILSVSWTRPFDTGHHTIKPGHANQIIWSSGSVKVQDTCEDSSWNYHSNLRGRRYLQWDNGPATFADELKC